MADYPFDKAAREGLRAEAYERAMAGARLDAFALVASSKCSGDGGFKTPWHSSDLGGCKNDGRGCLCSCHDREDAVDVGP